MICGKYVECWKKIPVKLTAKAMARIAVVRTVITKIETGMILIWGLQWSLNAGRCQIRYVHTYLSLSPSFHTI